MLQFRFRSFFFSFVLSGLAFGQGQPNVIFNPNPTRVIGHPQVRLATTAPNFVEGRELNSPQGVAADTSVNPPIVYVADTGNNRVLAWRSPEAPSGSPADKIIGQRDKYSTQPLGPGTSTSVGLNSPTGLAVDRNGNLYVADSGNNRILRFPRPLEQTGEIVQPDMVIGQVNFSGRLANQGRQNPDEKTILTGAGNLIYRAYLLFDSQGNLWFSDSGNHRVLRYPASALGQSATNAPAADLVLGQATFTTRNPVERLKDETEYQVRSKKNGLTEPSAIAFDASGNFFVSDSLNRVLVFPPPIQSGISAARIIGLYVNVQGQPAKPTVNEYTIFGSEGMFSANNYLFVVDTNTNRIVRHDPVSQWPTETETQPSPPAKAVFGQLDLLGFQPNRGQKQSDDSSYSTPTAVAYVGGFLFLADSANHRVLLAAVQNNQVTAATRVFGQLGFELNAPNGTEAAGLSLAALRFELAGGGGVTLGGGIVVDRNSNPPPLYIADTFNNRILGFRDVRRARPGDSADLIIGQRDGIHNLVNVPTMDINQPTDTGLALPSGVAVDSAGNLWVADTFNARVLRFPRPFDQPSGTLPKADLVIGQANFTSKITDATRSNLSRPVGITFSFDGHLLISDAGHNRVLVFRKPAGADFTNGMQATTVFGQQDFSSSGAGSAANRFNGPMGISMDSDDRLYVCDAGNNRVVIFNRAAPPPPIVPDTNPVFSIFAIGTADSLRSPQGIIVSQDTGEVWIADTPNGRVVRFPKFNELVLAPFANFGFTSVAPLCVALDTLGNILISDSANRVTMHYASLAALNAASYLSRPLSPGMIASLYPFGIRFGEETIKFDDLPVPLPLPKELGDIQVFVDAYEAPLYFVSPTQINIQIPWYAPTSGTAEFIVMRKSLGQILASANLTMGSATPGIFTMTQNGTGQIAALNEDGTVNSSTNQISRGKVIAIYMTGLGPLSGAPPDGAAPSGAVPMDYKPDVLVNTDFLRPEEILYAGLAPGLVGVWQLNLRIPEKVPPGNTIPVIVVMNSIPSNLDASGTRRILTTIAVKQ